MKKAIVLHNPGAGDEDHFRSELVRKIEGEGYKCQYFSLDDSDEWKDHLNDADFAVVVGGDGTVRNVVKELVQRDQLEKKLPLTVLPMGTANNLSLALNIDRELEIDEHIKLWKDSKLQKFDLGILDQGGDLDFFLEGAGFGLFPSLMQHMKDLSDKLEDSSVEEKLLRARKELHKLVQSAEAQDYWLKTDTETVKGKFILLEAMNIQSIGPNLVLCPDVVTDDGYLDVICVEDNQREELAAHVQSLIAGKPDEMAWKRYRTKKAIIECKSKIMHVDDELIKPTKYPIVFEARENILEFMVPWIH